MHTQITRWYNNGYPIYKLNQTMNTKLYSQDEAIIAIRGRKFILGSVDEDGNFSLSEAPVPHDTMGSARSEAKRLSRLTPGRVYVILGLAGGELVPKLVQSISL